MNSFVLQYVGKSFQIFLQIALFSFLIYFFVASPGAVFGRSMESTFINNDHFLVSTLSYFLHPPARLDVVQFLDPLGTNRLLMKRIIGLPGETVIIQNHHLVIRDASGKEFLLEEPYLDVTAFTTIAKDQPSSWEIPSGSYFVMGDNRVMSTDSRNFGPLGRAKIFGKIL